MKPRLLIATDSYIPRRDGVVRFLLEIIPRLQTTFSITVVAPRFPGRCKELSGVKVVRIPLIPLRLGDIQFARFQHGTIAELVKDADLVFNQSIGPIGMMTIKEAAKTAKPVTSFLHSIEWELASKSIRHCRPFAAWVVKNLARRHYSKCSSLLIPGDDVGVLLQSIGVKTPTQHISLGVDNTIFSPPANKAEAKKAVNIDPDRVVIGFVGRIAREKDIPTLQEAFDRVHRKHKNALLLIVGDGLRGQVRKDDNVMITGMVENVVPYLQAMDIYALPSLTEASSLSTMEAMSCALPILVTPVGNIPDYVEHRKNGWFFARHDIDDLAKKLTYLIERPELRSKLGVAARQTMIKSHSWDTTADAIAKALLSLRR